MPGGLSLKCDAPTPGQQRHMSSLCSRSLCSSLSGLVTQEALGSSPEWKVKTPLAIVQDAKDFLEEVDDDDPCSPPRFRLRTSLDPSKAPFEESEIGPSPCATDCGGLRVHSAKSIASTSAPTYTTTPGSHSRVGSGASSLGFGMLATLPPPRARLPALSAAAVRGLSALQGAASRSSTANAGGADTSSRAGWTSVGGLAAAFGFSIGCPVGGLGTSAPPTRGNPESMNLAGLGELPSPPRTDPPRRHRKRGKSRDRSHEAKGCSTSSKPDSPLPLPPSLASKTGEMLRSDSHYVCDDDGELDDSKSMEDLHALGQESSEIEDVAIVTQKVDQGGRSTTSQIADRKQGVRSRAIQIDSDEDEVLQDTEQKASCDNHSNSNSNSNKNITDTSNTNNGYSNCKHNSNDTANSGNTDSGDGSCVTSTTSAAHGHGHEEDMDLDQLWDAKDGHWAPESGGQAARSQKTVKDFLGTEELPESFGTLCADCDYWDDQSSGIGDLSNASNLFNDSVDGKQRRAAATPSVLSSSLGFSKTMRESQEIDSQRNSREMLAAGIVKGETFNWVKGELVGRGTLGRVWKALNRKTGELMAAKEVVLDPRDPDECKFRESLQNEIALYKDLNHPHIVSYLGNDFINNRLYIYLEFMPGGSISQVLSQFGPLEEPLIARYIGHLANGLDYLHTRDPPILHRDIKGANILVGLDRNVKLTDFGCSKRSGGTAIHTLKGSIPWMAPEVMRHSVSGRKADIWSLGCLLIEMSTASAPWGDFDNCLAAMVRIAMSEETPPVPSNLSSTLQDLIVRCTRRTPEERPSASQILEHEFVKGGADDASSLDGSWDAE
eukprot:TRINITY_DN14046_c0_g1_i1.p1 TRINITY_DN14046_c0_g1~~TRINITY_DN14046_c0_g1_i1.p1  ORF type:complete len:835 (+),score=168.08 TRINITY_DN14046_c0_g1_i1:109-2613(+)